MPTLDDFTDQLNGDHRSVDVYLIRATETEQLSERLAQKDPQAICFASLIGRFLRTVDSLNTLGGQKPRCLCCERSFHRSPAAVFILLPSDRDITEPGICASVSGICSRCAKKEERQLLKLVNKLFADGVLVDGVVALAAPPTGPAPTKH